MTTVVPPPGLRVLAIDDNALVLTALAAMLEVDGHRVSTAASGTQGLQVFEAAFGQGMPFDVVITDFDMPAMDGGEVARRVKQASPATWVAVLSGWGPGIESGGDWRASVDALMAKPPRLATLRAMLADARGARTG